MKQNIQISLLGIQNAGSEPEAILTKTARDYCFESGFHKILYCELDENGTATDNLLFLSETEMRLKSHTPVPVRIKFRQSLPSQSEVH